MHSFKLELLYVWNSNTFLAHIIWMVEGIVLVGESCTVYSRLVHTLHHFLELSLRCSIVAFFLSNHRTVGVSIQALHHGLHIHSLSERGRRGVLGVVWVFRSCTAPA